MFSRFRFIVEISELKLEISLCIIFNFYINLENFKSWNEITTSLIIFRNFKFTKLTKRNKLNHVQQHPDFFFLLLSDTAVVFIVRLFTFPELVDCEVSSLSSMTFALDFISFVIQMKASSTFSDFLAEVSRNLNPKLLANSLPSYVDTYLSDSRSFLFPTTS